MTSLPTVLVNKEGKYYDKGKAFTTSKWFSVAQIYYEIIEKEGKCTVRQLAKAAGISLSSANKAIINIEVANQLPLKKTSGHQLKGPGSISGLQKEHHSFIYYLYRNNPSLPLYGYCEELEIAYGIKLSEQTLMRWFKEIGPFKGTLRKTSTRPTGRNTYRVCVLLEKYLNFVRGISDRRRLVFADEKPMKEVMIFSRVRKDVLTNKTPVNIVPSSAKNRFNILCAVNLKGGNIPPCDFVVLEECTNAAVFAEFVSNLITNGTLVRGDIFVVDNCTVHFQGDNEGMEDALWELHGINMVFLPPYHPELNPTELVFHTLLERLKSEKARYKSLDAYDFVDAIVKVIKNIDSLDVINFYKECGYYDK